MLDENDKCDTITEIVKPLDKKECNDIGKIWKRNCPKCNIDIDYSNKYNHKYAEKNNRLCISCAAKGFVPYNKKPYDDNDLTRNCPNCDKLIYYKSRGSKNRGIRHNHLCHSCQNKIYTKRYKKISISMRKYKLKILGHKRHFNKNACEYFDLLSEEKGWKLQHALNGGEITFIGYSLDAYDKEKNIIVEYDERHHNGIKQKEKDLIRQQNLIDYLHCDFYRYDEKTKTLLKTHTMSHPENSFIGN